ncbi:MAG: DUF1003 domain-containing protein [Candidatus Levybacteria bacterium]|nr:DUF1003 domain-containing protein [Candidatus Levybacteria bacterium]
MKKETKHPPILINPIGFAKEAKPEQLLKNLRSFEGRLAGFFTYFSGTMGFVYFHVFWFTFWILANHGAFRPWIEPFDPFPYGLLTMVVSLEAIFLATFVLITQNREALVDTYRELEEEQEAEEEEAQHEEFEESVEGIQKDLDDIKNAISFINQKVQSVEKAKTTIEDGNGAEHK